MRDFGPALDRYITGNYGEDQFADARGGGHMSDLRCVTHRRCPGGMADMSDCEFERLVESRDPEGRLLALLVVDECERCDGEGGGSADMRPYKCPSCGGRGWQPRAEYHSYIDEPRRITAVVVPLPGGDQ